MMRDWRIIFVKGCVTLLCILAFALTVNGESVFAAVSTSCNPASNSSVGEACRKGAGNGAIWMNGVSGNGSGAQSAGTITKQVNDANVGSTTFYIHGAVNGYESVPARCVRLLTYAHQNKPSIDNGGCNVSDNVGGLARSGGDDVLGRWKIGGTLSDDHIPVDVDLNYVKQNWDSYQDGEYKVFHNGVYIYRCWDTYATCGTGASSFAIKIKVKASVPAEFESSASSSAGSDGYIGEKLTNPPSVTLNGRMTNGNKATCTHDHTAHGGTVTCTVTAVSKTKNYKFYIEKDKNPGSLSGNSSYDGDDPWDWVKVNHYALQSLGNNISVNVPDDAGYVGRKWCASGAIKMGAKESWTERWTERYVSGHKADGTAIWSTRSRTTTGTKTYWQPWNISPASCVVIMKKMNAGVAGSSTYAAGGIYGAKAKKHTSKTYGSWAEFLAITKNGGIDWGSDHKGFSSGSALYGGVSTSGNNIKTLSKMSVGNRGIGTGSASVPAANVQSSNGFLEALNKIAKPGAANATVVRSSGNLMISGGTSSNKNHQTIYYSENGNIYIAPGVTTVNAWLIAPNGVIDTCATNASNDTPNLGSAGMQANQCTNKLTINGLVYAKGMRLDRTAGGAGNSVAEVINLTPASYVWAHTQATQTYASPRTVYSRELAPRM